MGVALEPGTPVWIVGGGASLRGFDWGKLHGTAIVAINKAMLEPALDWSVGISIDYAFWKQFGLQLDAENRGPRVHVAFPGAKDPPCGWTVVQRAKRLAVPNPHLAAWWGETPDEIGMGGSSGFAALNYADARGCSPLRLLGFDCHGDGEGGQAWWHDGYEERQQEAVYERMAKAFEAVRGLVRGRVENYGPTSRLWFCPGRQLP